MSMPPGKPGLWTWKADSAIGEVDSNEPVLAWNQETDPNADYKIHRFLDLNKPLLMQVWNGGFTKDFYLEQVHRPRYYLKGGSAPLFGNFLEPLSKTAWYVIPMIWLPPVAYGSLLAYQGLPSIPQIAAYWLIGLALWTLVEYGLHRACHAHKYLPNNRVGITAHFMLHGIHHYLPMDKYRLAMPPVLFLALATPFYKLAYTVFFYNCLTSYYARLQICHLMHHYTDHENGFGITSRFWDVMFGTDIALPEAARTSGLRGPGSSPSQERQHNPQSQRSQVDDAVVQSPISEEDDTLQRRLKRSFQDEITAQANVATSLALHPSMYALYEEVLLKVGMDRFEDRFVRLLEGFYLDLLQDADTDLERAISGLLRPRGFKIRLAARVIRQYRLVDNNARSDWNSNNRVTQDEPSSNNALNPNAQHVETSDTMSYLDWGVVSDSDEDDVDVYDEYDKDVEVYDEYVALPFIDEMRSVMSKGNAFKNLTTGLKILLLPPNIRPLSRILMTIPSDRLWVSTKEDISLFNKTKAFVEQVSEKPWCWWPLRPRMRLLRNEETRIHWRCHCGTHLWTEISVSDAKLVSDLLANRGTVNEQNHLCRPRRRQDFWTWSRISDGMHYAKPSTSERQGQYNPSPGPLSSQNPPTIGVNRTPQHSQTRNTSTTEEAQKNQQQPVSTAIEVQGTSQSVVLLGVKGPRITLELAQIDTIKNGKDNLFFRSLKQQYKQHRGSFRYWLSIWRLNHCDFVKFEKIWADAMISRGKDLPTDPIYDYTPRPPNAANPPISPHEFEAAFALCRDKCMLAPFHHCQKVPDRDFALKRIPKRKSEVESKINGREDVWGLQAQHAISVFRVLVYHCLILAGPIAFWAWWLVKHPGDLQSAAVPLSTCLTLLSLFWSSAGILKGSHE